MSEIVVLDKETYLLAVLEMLRERAASWDIRRQSDELCFEQEDSYEERLQYLAQKLGISDGAATKKEPLEQIILKAVKDRFANDPQFVPFIGDHEGLMRERANLHHRFAKLAEAVGESIRELSLWPADLRKSVQGVCAVIENQPDVGFVQRAGEELQGLVSSVESLLARYRSGVVQPLARKGFPIAEIPLLDSALEQVVKLKADTLDHWPWPPTPEEEEELRAERERGDHLPLEDAFAEIAGVDRKIWLERVEARRQELLGKTASEP